MTKTEMQFPVGSWERPDPAGIVRRGEAAHFRSRWEEGAAPRCFVGHQFDCERVSVMEVYGLQFCEAHGEEAASGALEEIAFDLEQELQRPMNPHTIGLSAHFEYALRQGMMIIPSPDSDDDEAVSLTAYPLDRERVCTATLDYVEDPGGQHNPPYDTYIDARLLLCRHMRLAFEAGATWLVEMLEKERESVAAQAAWALVLEKEAGLR